VPDTYSEQWTRLQKQLVNHGYIDREAVVEVASDHDISAQLIAAIIAAQEDVGAVSGSTAVPVEDGLRLEDIDLLVDIVEALQGRFCGVPDRGGTLGPLTFGSPGGRWTRGVLRVSINPANCTFVNQPLSPPTNPVAVIIGAFAQWQAASSFFAFNFVPPNSGEDVRVVFGGPQVDPRFVGPGGVAGSAGYPEEGNVQFDATETWTLGPSPTGSAVDLLAVALHEIGHLLGLSHSNVPNALMNPYVPATNTIDAESQNAINAMYGWQPPTLVPDRGTSDRASLGITSTSNFTSRSETPLMVWKGVGDDYGIFYSELRDGWTPQQPVPDVGCSYSPSLTSLPSTPIPGGGLSAGTMMAWKGVGSDPGIYWTRYTGAYWESQRQVANFFSSAAPALATVNGQICLACKGRVYGPFGANNDPRIYWCTYDGAESFLPQQNPIAGAGTSDSPALVGYNGMLYMFWKGIPGDEHAYYSFFDFANDPIWKPQRRIEYFSYETSGGVPHPIGTTGGLSATVRGDSILLTWKGIEGDPKIWFSLFRNGEFSGQAPVPNALTTVGPSVVQADGRTYMAWKGVGDDYHIYWSRL